MWPSAMTLSLDFQGQFLTVSQEWEGSLTLNERDVCRWDVRLTFDFKLWPHPWPWSWIFKVKFWNCCISGMGGGWVGGGRGGSGGRVLSKVVATFNHVAGPLIFFYGHHWGCLNNPVFSNLGLCAARWAHFMCHHELWPTSVSHLFFFLNSSLCLAGGKH